MGDSRPFNCPLCGAVSHNPSDVEQLYCGACHVFLDDAAVLAAEAKAIIAEWETYQAIIFGRQEPDPTFYRAGLDAHDAGSEFHEGPKPHHTIEGLCWRMGWNDRALGKTRDG